MDKDPFFSGGGWEKEGETRNRKIKAAQRIGRKNLMRTIPSMSPP
jgi:hypothetical protein